MKYNLLGNTGLKVSELCFGTMTFGAKGRFKDIGGVEQNDADILLKQALDKGVNFVDTANVYSEGVAEEMTGKALLHQEAVTSVIIGAKKEDQLQDNLKSVEVEFSDEELEKLKEVSQLPKEYPGWMLEFTSQDRQ